jgi:signal transduction histidine kinase
MKRSSLFTKFTLLIVLATIVGLIITHFAMYLYFSNNRKKIPLGEGIHLVAEIIASQIDNTSENANRKLLERYGFNVRYIKGNIEWFSSKDVPTLKIIKEKSNGKHTFWLKKNLITVVNHNDAVFIFQGLDPFGNASFPWDIMILWSCLMIVLFGFVHFRIRYFLKPLRILHEGVLKAGSGDFTIELPRTSSDELGQLIDSFNNMALKVRNDIKSRDQLLRDISHELRSPLSRMMVALEFVPENSMRQILKNNILTLEKMTSSILEEERIDSPYGKIKREIFDLKSLITEIVDSRRLDGCAVALLNSEPVEICADKERIKMALSNVIDNGIKYSRNNTKPVEVRYSKDDLNTSVSITDYGIGIPESEIPFIFEPFYRVDKARKNTGGYGLGMSLLKKIIDAHRGTIMVNSVPNSGTTIYIKLPIF